jgi:hypothetical protein
MPLPSSCTDVGFLNSGSAPPGSTCGNISTADDQWTEVTGCNAYTQVGGICDLNDVGTGTPVSLTCADVPKLKCGPCATPFHKCPRGPCLPTGACLGG